MHNLSLTEIDNLFPLETPRDGQLETISWMLERSNAKKFIILEAPCGAGKSAIAIALARAFES